MTFTTFKAVDFSPFKAVYSLLSIKLIFWAIGRLMFKMVIPDNNIGYPLEQDTYFQLIMLAVGVVGALNLFWDSKILYRTVLSVMAFLWTYALFEFGVDNISFARTLPETVVLYYLCYKSFKI